MNKTSIEELEDALNAVAGKLPGVSGKKMFGCHALWVGSNVFALVWKHGRIGVKLPDEDAYALLMKQPGAEPWKAGPMKMAHWVLVPAAFHEKRNDLKKWTLKAHDLCSKLEPKKKAAPNRKKKMTAKVKKNKIMGSNVNQLLLSVLRHR